MSKNFELLQRIGNEEELFRTASQSLVAIVAKKGERNPELDKGGEKIAENSSLPDILQTATEVSGPPLDECSELGSDLNPEGESPNPQRLLSAAPFRNSTAEPAKHVQNRPEQSSPNSDCPTSKPGPDSKTQISSAATVGGSLSEGQREARRRYFPESVSSLAWIAGGRAARNVWGGLLQAHNHQRGIDVDMLAREEEIRLVQRIFPGTDEDSPRIALFAALEGGIGCASICARAAEALAARAEGPVCAVDANFWSPFLHKYFGVENERGLVDATLESGPIQNFVQQIPVPDLWLIPSGKAAAQLRFPAMADGLRVRMAELRKTFRYVVIHSGPLRLETGAMLLSRWTDGVVLVLEANATRRDRARRATESLAAAGVRLLGVVLNNRTFPIPEAIYRRL